MKINLPKVRKSGKMKKRGNINKTVSKNEFIKDVGLKILFNAIFLGIAVYFVVQFISTNNSGIETERADLEIRQDIVELSGYIFRNEEVLYTSGGKSVNYLIEDGGKVGKQQIIAHLTSTAFEYSLKNRIDALEKKLNILEKSNINLEFVTANIEKIDSDSHALYMDMLNNIQKNKIKTAGKDRDDLLILLNKKQIITKEAGGNNFDSLIKSVEESKSELETQMLSSSGAYVDIMSDKSGIFYSRTDGYENYFTGDAAKTLDFDSFGNLISQNPDDNILNGALGKVAYDYSWYLVCKTVKNKNAEFVVGKTYDIIYPYSSNKTIPSKLIKQTEKVDSDEILLTFETMSVPEDFDFSRKQTIQIVFNEVRGIRVPKEAVMVVDKDDLKNLNSLYNSEDLSESETETEIKTETDTKTEENINTINPDDIIDIIPDDIFDETVAAIETTEIIKPTGITQTETNEKGEIVRRYVNEDIVKGVYVLRGNIVYFRKLPDSECVAAFDSYYLYTEPSRRSDTGERGELQLYEDIIVSGKNLYIGKVVN